MEFLYKTSPKNLIINMHLCNVNILKKININNNTGFMLVSVLLFLTIISLLFVVMNEHVWLTNNINNINALQTKLFYQTEAELLKQERIVSQKRSCNDNSSILYASCGINICLVSAQSQQNNLTVALQSSFAIIDNSAICPNPPLEKEGRLAWWKYSK